MRASDNVAQTDVALVPVVKTSIRAISDDYHLNRSFPFSGKR
ncbi:hypothetical protein ACE1TH_09670 [Shouchella sp. JSM 1781072]|nr:hypothetical protein [Bacillus sp. Marseille-P3800]